MAGGEAGFHGKKHAWRSGLNSGKLDRQAQPHQPPTQLPACPECGSQRTWKNGVRYTNRGEVQRYICRSCGYRFSETTWNNSDEHEHVERVHTTALYSVRALPFNRQVCVTETQGAKNLAEVESRIEKRAAGATKASEADIKGKIVNFLWSVEKRGYAKETIRGTGSCLRALLHRNADLLNPESVKEVLAKEKSWSPNRRRNVINAYDLFLKFIRLQWEKPRCNVVRKFPFIPTEQEIDSLIAGSPKKAAVFLQLLKETAMRCGEAKRILWTDIDFDRRAIILNDPEKNSNPRIWNVSPKLLNMLNALPRKSLRVFGDGPINSMKTTFIKARRRLAAKLQNPRLLQIHFHTLRHWKATMEYHRTKDPMHVMAFLGHKKLDNIQLYVQLDQKLFKDCDDSFIVRVAHNVGETIALVEVGFEYVTGEYNDGGKIFRKRK